MLGDTRLLVQSWREGGLTLPEIHSVLGKETLARSRDIFAESFRPRMITGNPPEAWRVCRLVEDRQADQSSIRAIYYWVTARCEATLHAFVIDEVYPRFLQGLWVVQVNDCVRWLKESLARADINWTPSVTVRVAQGMLAALRDFGILEGRARKRIAPPDLSLEAISLLAFLLHRYTGASGKSLLESPDWKLFLLSPNHVERLFLEAHQSGYLNYQAAGSTVRIEFPTDDLKEYVGKLFG